MTSITQVGTFKQSAATATNPGVVNTPSGAAAGDLLIFFVGFYLDSTTSTTTITPPSGAVLVPGSRVDHVLGSDNYIASAMYTLSLTGTPASSYTFSLSPSGTYGVGVTCVCLRSADPMSPIDTKSVNDGNSNTPTATGVTIAGSNEWLFLFFLGDSNSVVNTNFPSFSYYFITDSGGNDKTYASFAVAWGVGVIQNITTGATGNYQATLSASDDWITSLIAIKPNNNIVLPTDSMFFGMT